MNLSTEFTPEIKSFLNYAYPYAQEIAMNNGLSLDEDWHINDGRVSDIHPQWQMLKEGNKIVEVDLFYFLENGYELGKIELELEDGETEIEFDFPEWEVKQERKFEYGGIMAKGGAVGEIDMDEIEKSAQFYTDEARWSKKPAIENFEADVEKYEELKEQLDNKETTPSKIIGRGYKPQYARPLAYKWLNEQILVAKRAIEILKERQGKMKDGGEVGMKIRFDMYGYEDLNNKVQDGDTIIRVESYSMAEKKAKEFLYDNNYKLVELYRKDELVGSIEHGGKFVYSKKYMSKHPEFNNVMADGGQVSGRYFIVKDGEYLTMMYGKYKFTDNKEFAYSWDASDESAQRLADSFGAKLKNVLDNSEEEKSDKSMKFIQYNGQEIMHEPHYNEYLVGEETFQSLEAAQNYIDGSGKKPSAKTINSYRHGMMAKGGSIKEADIVAGKTFNLKNGEEIKIVRLFTENGDEDWVEYERGGKSQENSVKQLRQFMNTWRMEHGGEIPKKDSMLHYMLNEASSGSIGNKTKYSSYKDIDGVRFAAIQILNRDGDRKYSVSAFNDLIKEAVLEYDENRTMAKGGMTQSKAIDLFAEYQENEEDNYHGENVLLLADNFGSEEDLEKIKSINKKHEQLGELPNELYRERFELHQKLYPLLLAAMDSQEKKWIERVEVGDFLEASTGVEVVVVDYDESFGGRVRVLRTDEYSDGKPSPWKSVKDFKKKVDGKLYTIGKSKKKNSIELDTPIMPTIVADGVARDVLTEDNFDKFDSLVNHLVSKANTEYEENEIFRAKIKRRGNLGRDYLELTMKSWADKYLTGGRKKFDV